MRRGVIKGKTTYDRRGGTHVDKKTVRITFKEQTGAHGEYFVIKIKVDTDTKIQKKLFDVHICTYLLVGSTFRYLKMTRLLLAPPHFLILHIKYHFGDAFRFFRLFSFESN